MPGNPLLLQLVLPSTLQRSARDRITQKKASCGGEPDTGPQRRKRPACWPPGGGQAGRWPSGNLRYLLHITWSTRPYSAASCGSSTLESSDSTTVLRPSALTAPTVL